MGCTSEESEIHIPDNIPDFVETSDFDKIDWENKAETFNRNIIGNKNKSGIIGAALPSVKQNQKWMWHLWGIEEPRSVKLTVIGFHKETEEVHQILTTGWTLGLGGENNGADAHVPSSVNLAKAGEWAVLLYTDEKLFDTLILNIDE